MTNRCRTPWLLRLLLAIGISQTALPAAAAPCDSLPGLIPGPDVTVTEVGYGGSFDVSTGDRVRLLNLKVPKPPAPAFAKQAEPLGAEARTFVQTFSQNHRLQLCTDDVPRDRYGRMLAHVVRDDGTWLQAELLRNGLAQVYSFADNRRNLHQLLALEAKARQDKRGIWQLAHYRIRTAAEVRPGGFQIVEGRVTAQSKGQKTVFLNFGDDWKRDFTVRIAAEHREAFRETGRFPSYRNKVVRVRGWVYDHDGPMIDATHPEQIEILDRPVSSER